MTETEKKALALVRECESDYEALCRAIEQHEAFRQEVSDAAVEYNEHGAQSGWLGFDHFIIAKPDPLVEALWDAGFAHNKDTADQLRAALAARGLEIREKQ